MERKASDILLELESKINILLKICHNQDMTNKVILDRVNKIFLSLEKNNNNIQSLPETPSEDDIFKMPDELLPIEVDENPTGSRRTSRHETHSSNKTSSTTTNEKIAVSQKIVDSGNKDIFMAEVLVLDQAGQLVHKTKTNAVGKWQAYLKPGKYSVHINKNDAISKKRLESSQEIEISHSDGPLKLSNLIFKK